MVWGISSKIPPKNEKNSQIKIASAHIHIPRNNPVKIQNYLIDSLGGVGDKELLYIYVYQRNSFGGICPQNEKIPN